MKMIRSNRFGRNHTIPPPRYLSIARISQIRANFKGNRREAAFLMRFPPICSEYHVLCQFPSPEDEKTRSLRRSRSPREMFRVIINTVTFSSRRYFCWPLPPPRAARCSCRSCL
jgi:hypothetical protein